MMRWMIYVLIVTLILGIAALSAERALRLRLRRTATRWAWIAAIFGSLVIPALIAFVSFQVPNLTTSAPPKVIALRDTTSLPLDAIALFSEVPSTWRARENMDSQLERFWLAASGAMILLLAGSAIQLFWRKRRWTRVMVAGKSVYTAPKVGPAVAGLLHPQIVVPPWVVESSPSRQALIIAHEQAHLDARDPLLLTSALCVLVFTPWNLPLWWTIRRLRHAMEVDCDARVLGAGHDANRYAETLIDVGERQSSSLGTVAAMSESSSLLEQRIQFMLRKPTGWWRTSAALLGGAAVCLVAAAMQVSPPGLRDPASQIVALAAVHDGYVGYYRAEGGAIMAIKRDGQRLVTRILGQPEVEAVPSGPAEFFAKAVNARITFDTDAHGRATAVTWHQNNRDVPASRISDVAGKQMDDALSARVRSQTPHPGSEPALRRLFAGFRAGKPVYELMAPALAQATRQQFDTVSKSTADFGEIQSIEFRGVGNNGWDVFYVKHAHALVTWRIFMAPDDGAVQGLLFHTGP